MNAIERPIIFSATMVRAILDGRKTQTRRILKPAPQMVTDARIVPWEGQPEALRDLLAKQKRTCPYGKPGDRLWMREPWAYYGGDAYLYQRERGSVAYRAGGGDHPLLVEGLDPIPGGRWRPSIHMPRWASRILLEITDVRVQRLLDISGDDAAAEGVRVPVDSDSQRPLIDISSKFAPSRYLPKGALAKDAPALSIGALLIAHFAALWDSINSARAPWESNPWVWAITFKRIEART